MEKKCEHRWKRNGCVVLDNLDEYHNVTYQYAVSSIYCEKCGEIKVEILD